MDLLNTIRIFVSVGRTESFSETARTNGMSVSSVARQIDSLEQSVGSVLVTRSTRHIRLTEAGRRFMTRAERLLSDTEEAVNHVRDAELIQHGVLRVTCAPSIGQLVLPGIISAFVAENPNIHLDFVVTDTVMDLRKHDIDVALRVANPSHDPESIAHDLLPMNRVVCASANYLKQFPKPEQPIHLQGHNCLLFRPLTVKFNPWDVKTQTWKFSCDRHTHRVVVRGKITSSDADSLRAAALSGLGIVALPDWMVASDLKAGRLVRLLDGYLIGDTSEEKPLHIAYGQHRRDSPKVRSFVRLAKEYFKDKSQVPALTQLS